VKEEVLAHWGLLRKRNMIYREDKVFIKENDNIRKVRSYNAGMRKQLWD